MQSIGTYIFVIVVLPKNKKGNHFYTLVKTVLSSTYVFRSYWTISSAGLTIHDSEVTQMCC